MNVETIKNDPDVQRSGGQLDGIPAISIVGAELRRCIACGALAQLPVFEVPGDVGTDETFRYVKCSDCGTASLEDQAIDFSRYYADDYYSFKVGQGSGLK